MTTDYCEHLNAPDRMFVLMLLHLHDSCFPPPPSVMSVLPAAASSPTERGEFSLPSKLLKKRCHWARNSANEEL